MLKRFLQYCLLSTVITVSGTVLADNHENADDPALEPRHKGIGHRKHRRERMHRYMMERVDLNGDGQIDLNEYLANAEQRFKNLDLDGNGYVTMEEGREAHKMMRNKHREMRSKYLEERHEGDAGARDDKTE